MHFLKRQIECIMDEQPVVGAFLFRGLLSMFSWGYRCIVQSRNFFYQQGFFSVKKLPCKVVAIGNLCVGGTGKTPMTLYTANLLKNMGLKVCVVSRGYKGGSEKKGGVVSDGSHLLMDVHQAGDEPFMMAKTLKNIPVIVGRDRFRAGTLAVKQFNIDVIVLDDGFQHRRLFRDLDLVLLDYQKPFGNARLLPRGRLREPVSALDRSHGVIFTRSQKQNPEERARHFVDKDIKLKNNRFFAYHEPFVNDLMISGTQVSKNSDDHGLDRLREKAVFAFSGIADNQKFLETLHRCCGTVVGFMDFDDHFTYKVKDYDAIIKAAKKANADIIVTTQKDSVKIPNHIQWPTELVIMGIHFRMEDVDKFTQFLKERLLT